MAQDLLAEYRDRAGTQAARRVERESRLALRLRLALCRQLGAAVH